MSRIASLRRPFVAGSIAIASAALVVSCAIAGVIRDGSQSGNDATMTGDTTTGTMDTPLPPTDVGGYPCTGTTCVVANGIGACVAGNCQIGSCSMGYSDINRNPMDGCECMAGSLSTSCGTPTDQMTIASGGMRMVEGLLSTTMGENWLRVNFATGGHPRVRFMTNPGMNYRFDIVRSCMMGQQFMCPDRPAGATGLTEWEFFDNANDAGMEMVPNPDGGAADGGTRMTTWPATVYVRVSTTANASECMRYTLVMSN
jgi:hypothetical protein